LGGKANRRGLCVFLYATGLDVLGDNSPGRIAPDPVMCFNRRGQKPFFRWALIGAIIGCYLCERHEARAGNDCWRSLNARPVPNRFRVSDYALDEKASECAGKVAL